MQITKSAYKSLLSCWSKSIHGGCTPSKYSKSYMLFSAIDAALAAIDFFKKNVHNGIVDSPPSRGPWRSRIVSASSLKDCPCMARQGCSPLPIPRPSRTPH